MKVYRWMALATGASLAAVAPMPAAAQVDGAIVLNILRECAKIGDANARLACYDNNIRSAGDFGSPQAAAPSASLPAPTASPVQQGSSGFGGETVRSPEQRASASAGQQNAISAQIARINQREPGVYLFDLQDGAQWVFNESVSRQYVVPSAGSTVEIRRASLGSFMMHFNGQQGVRVRRVR